MGYQNMMDALNLRMPKKVPRTEYSANGHWKLIQAVTGIEVDYHSEHRIKAQAAQAFEKAWDYGFTWSILTHNQIFGDLCTKMGHAVYADGGVDYDNRVVCPFDDVEQVLKFDPYAAYGVVHSEEETAKYTAHYRRNCLEHPDQVNMTGIYVTMISGLIEIFGWDWLLTALGEDADAFGEMTNRYADWILQYFEALAQAEGDVVMIHDDIVWTEGAFANPKWYRKYIFPNYEKLFAPLHRAGKKIMYTSDGTFTEFMDDIAACGVHAFVMEPTTDMASIAKKYGKTHAFVGNADCRILTFGTREEIKKEVQRCFDIGRDCPGFVFAAGNHIPSNVPVENAIYYNDCYEELAERSR